MASASELTSYRYTSATCVLEVVAEVSALTQWTEQPVLKRGRFQLTFDLQPADLQPADLHRASLRSSTDTPPLVFRGTQQQLLDLIEVVQGYLHSTQVASFATHWGSDAHDPDLAEIATASHPPAATTGLTPTETIRGLGLTAEGLTQHRLTLGRLRQKHQPEALVLSTLELLDLESVLDAFEQSAIALPALTPAAQARSFNQWRWVGASAAGILLAVGIATSIPRLLTSPTTGSNEAASPAPADGERYEAPSEAAAPPTATSSAPAITTPSNESDDPLIAESSGEAPTPNLPTAPKQDNSKQAETNGNRVRQPTSESGNLRYPNPSASPSGLDSSPPTQAPEPTPESASEADAITATAEPYNAAGTATSQASRTTPPAPPITPAASTPEDQSPEFPTTAGSGILNDSQAEIIGGSTRTASDLPTWLNTLKQQIQNQWSPLPGVSETLVYGLTISPEGSIQSLIPLTAASRTYQSQIPVAVSATPVVPPPPTQSAITVRLLLKGNGEVQVVR